MNKGVVEVVKGNAIDYALDNPNAAFFHVVNCQGVMGSGVAKEVKDRVPDAYSVYKDSFMELGTVSIWSNFFNLAAQFNYGGFQRNLNYGALADCLKYISTLAWTRKYDTIVVPYKMGADRSGGDWKIVVEMLEYYFPNHYLIACKL